MKSKLTLQDLTREQRNDLRKMCIPRVVLDLLQLIQEKDHELATLKNTTTKDQSCTALTDSWPSAVQPHLASRRRKL
ncbi:MULTISPECIES: hypothetical protein [Burkholderia]|uniref:hypothetical protein n=1 Tax=Burkholderia TaxID=32008 RepID=UPI0011AF9ACB|nr:MULTISPECIES: hypothetical protein [Burkholderia]